MGKPEVKKLSLETIVETVRRLSDVEAARSVLPFAVGAVLIVSGRVEKVVKRDGQCKLVIESGEVSGFFIFADCPGELENLTKLHIRRNSRVTVRGSLVSFGNRAINLSACRCSVAVGAKLEQVGTQKKRKRKLNKT